MNKNLPNQSYDSRIEHEIIFNKFTVGTDNTPTNWKQSLRTKQFDNIQTAQQTPFLFAVTDVIFNQLELKTIEITNLNNIFTFYEEDATTAPPVNNITIPVGKYTISELCLYIQTEINTVKSATGFYTLGINTNGQTINLLYTTTEDLANDSWNISLKDISSRTAIEQACYSILGFQNNPNGFSRNINALYYFNISIDCILLTCDKLRYATQITSNNNTNITTQTLLMIPIINPGTNINNYNPKELNWVQTLGFPFENVINWKLVDIYGNIIETTTDFNFKFLLNIQTIGNIKVI